MSCGKQFGGQGGAGEGCVHEQGCILPLEQKPHELNLNAAILNWSSVYL